MPISSMNIPSHERLNRMKEVEACIRSCPDFPKKGIVFRDLFPVLRCPRLFEYLLDELQQMALHCSHPSNKIDAVVAIGARGFLFGPALAIYLNCSFVPARKIGKLPGPSYSATYDLEYGKDTLQLQQDALRPNDRVLLVDDLLATGGTLCACAELVRQADAVPVAAIVVIELSQLGGRKKLDNAQVPISSVFKYGS